MYYGPGEIKKGFIFHKGWSLWLDGMGGSVDCVVVRVVYSTYAVCRAGFLSIGRTDGRLCQSSTARRIA